MADGLRNITKTLAPEMTRPPGQEDVGLTNNCTDHQGQYIPSGLLYTPRGSDACRVCTCASGEPILCRTVLCAPPNHCDSIKVRSISNITYF